ncbi:MAG TPA: TlpA disulfide reductase family protein [Gammaproteobacteria bacterium]|nr:TlpA disulfide reductase family protein [Gammaproteobacteria bacterium]
MKPVTRVAGVLLIAFAASLAHSGDLPQGIMQLAGKPAPGLQLDNLDGESYDLENSRGRWRFVHFWASWCGPCRKEMPSIDRISRLLEDSDIEFVLVNTAETEDNVFTFLAAVAPDLMPLLDSDGLATEAWQPRGLPATYLVDPDGLIRYQALGGREWEQPAYLAFLRNLDR